jgi:hypothetical protein
MKSTDTLEDVMVFGHKCYLSPEIESLIRQEGDRRQ